MPSIYDQAALATTLGVLDDIQNRRRQEQQDAIAAQQRQQATQAFNLSQQINQMRLQDEYTKQGFEFDPATGGKRKLTPEEVFGRQLQQQGLMQEPARGAFEGGAGPLAPDISIPGRIRSPTGEEFGQIAPNEFRPMEDILESRAGKRAKSTTVMIGDIEVPIRGVEDAIKYQDWKGAQPVPVEQNPKMPVPPNFKRLGDIFESEFPEDFGAIEPEAKTFAKTGAIPKGKEMADKIYEALGQIGGVNAPIEKQLQVIQEVERLKGIKIPENLKEKEVGGPALKFFRLSPEIMGNVLKEEK